VAIHEPRRDRGRDGVLAGERLRVRGLVAPRERNLVGPAADVRPAEERLEAIGGLLRLRAVARELPADDRQEPGGPLCCAVVERVLA